MSNKRAEMRRNQREVIKHATKEAAQYRNMPGFDLGRYVYEFGIHNDRLKTILDERSKEMFDKITDECIKELIQAERYMMSADVIIAIVALRMTFGDLKTVQKGLNRFVGNFNKALDYVDSKGIAESYRELEAAGLDMLEFDDFDINALWEPGQKIRDIVFQVWKEIQEDFKG